MEAKAIAKTVRVTPRKARLVLDQVRGKSVDEALAILKFTPNKAAGEIAKVVKSAAANAVNNYSMNENQLYIKSCFADEGVVLKRWMPRAKGSASQILKRTSHITVVVSDEK
jgi:large subunit ribosomal protein L22